MAESKTLKAMDKAVIEGTAGEAKKADEKAKKLVLQAEQTYLELAEVLVEIRDKVLFKKILDKDGKAYTDFKKYCVGELSMAGRKGMYLMNVYDQLVIKGKVSREKLEKIPFSKAREFAPLVNDEKDAEFWIEKAGKQTYDELVNDVKDERRKTGVTPEGEVTRKLQFTLFDAQYKNWEMAKKHASKDAESDKEGHLLDLICTAYMAASALNQDVKDDELMRVFMGLERVYGISILAVKDDEKMGGEPVYCSKKMERKMKETDK